MNPTRPIDAKKPALATGTRAVGSATAPSRVAEISEADGRAAVDAALTLDVATVGNARAEAKRLDTQRLQALRAEVQSDSYHVDPEALARRIVEDALGPEPSE